MAEPVDTIDTRLKALYAGVEVNGTTYFNHVDDWEPEVRAMPAALFMYAGGTQQPFDTSGGTDNRWPWDTEIYLSSLIEGSKVAIARFRDAWPALMKAFREDRDLGGAVSWLELALLDEPLQLDYDRNYIFKRLRVVAVTEEY